VAIASAWKEKIEAYEAAYKARLVKGLSRRAPDWLAVIVGVA
jgi:hypothetical protein